MRAYASLLCRLNPAPWRLGQGCCRDVGEADHQRGILLELDPILPRAAGIVALPDAPACLVADEEIAVYRTEKVVHPGAAATRLLIAAPKVHGDGPGRRSAPAHQRGGLDAAITGDGCRLWVGGVVGLPSPGPGAEGIGGGRRRCGQQQQAGREEARRHAKLLGRRRETGRRPGRHEGDGLRERCERTHVSVGATREFIVRRTAG